MLKSDNLRIMKTILLLCSILAVAITSTAQVKERSIVISTNLGDIKCRLYNDTPLHRDKFLQEAAKEYYNGTLFYRVIKNFMIQGGSKGTKNAKPGQRIGYGDPDFTVSDEILPNHIHKKGALCAPRQPDAINPFKQSDISQFFIIQGKVYRPGELDTMELARNLPLQKEIQQRLMTPQISAQLQKLKEEKKVEEFRAIANPIKEQMEAEMRLHPERLKFTPEQRKAFTTIGGYPDLDGKYTIFGEVISGFEVIDKIANLKTDANNRPLIDVRLNVKVLK